MIKKLYNELESNNTGFNCVLPQNATVPEGIDYPAVTISRCHASGWRTVLSTEQSVKYRVLCDYLCG